jgi:hypothetical protein
MKAKADSKRAVSGDELAAIWNSPAEIRDAVFIHRTLCQVGFAREDPKQGRYKRTYVSTHLLIEHFLSSSPSERIYRFMLLQNGFNYATGCSR